jgi:hypothetical protein
MFIRWLQPQGMMRNISVIISHHHLLANTKSCQPWPLTKTVNISNIWHVRQSETWQAGWQVGKQAYGKGTLQKLIQTNK